MKNTSYLLGILLFFSYSTTSDTIYFVYADNHNKIYRLPPNTPVTTKSGKTTLLEITQINASIPCLYLYNKEYWTKRYSKGKKELRLKHVNCNSESSNDTIKDLRLLNSLLGVNLEEDAKELVEKSIRKKLEENQNFRYVACSRNERTGSLIDISDPTFPILELRCVYDGEIYFYEEHIFRSNPSHIQDAFEIVKKHEPLNKGKRKNPFEDQIEDKKSTKKLKK